MCVLFAKGNIEAKEGQEDTSVDISDPNITLHGPYSVIGRSLVVHADKDDFGKGGHDDSFITGHAGARLSCGIIALSKL